MVNISKIHITIDLEKHDISTKMVTKEEGLPQNESLRLNKFMDIYNQISGKGKVEVAEHHLRQELILAGFLADETNYYIHLAMQNGQIYESKSGWYKKA